jgi:hypothetical protein
VSAPARRRLFPRGEAAAALCALGLLASMFAFAWYGVDLRPGAVRSSVTAVDAWHGLTIVRWLMLATIFLALASLILDIAQRRHGARTNTSLPLAALATVTSALLVYRVLIEMPNPPAIVDQKLGALIGLVFALALTLFSWDAVRDSRRLATRVTHRPRGG